MDFQVKRLLVAQFHSVILALARYIAKLNAIARIGDLFAFMMGHKHPTGGSALQDIEGPLRALSCRSPKHARMAAMGRYPTAPTPISQ